MYDKNAPFSQASHEICIFLKRNIQNEQKVFLKLNIRLKGSTLLATKSFQTTETWRISQRH